MSDIIDPQNLKAGDLVTVLQWKSRKDRSWVGDPMKITAVSLPFVALESRVWGAVRLDTREVDLTAISQEYFDAGEGGAK